MTDSAAAPVAASTKATLISVHAEKLPFSVMASPTCTSAIDPNGVVMVVAACPDGSGPSMNNLSPCSLQPPSLALQLQLRPVYCSTNSFSFVLARRSRWRPFLALPMPMPVPVSSVSASMPHASCPTRSGHGMAPTNVGQTNTSLNTGSRSGFCSGSVVCVAESGL